MTFWRLASWYRDSIVGLVCLTLVLTPFFAMMPAAHADEIVDEANKGQDTGANLLLNYQVPGINNGPAGDPLGPNEIGIQDVFPGFDPADPTQLDPFTGLMSDPTNLSTQGVAQQFLLQSGTGNEAEAYQSVTDGSNNPHNATIDLRNDSFLDRSREIISGNDPILDEILTACAEDVTAGDPGTDTITRLTDVYTCSQLRTGLSGTCTVDRDFILVPVATQTILAVLGGTCEPSPAGSGLDASDWNIQYPGALMPRGLNGAMWCQLSNVPDNEHFMRKGEFTPTAQDYSFHTKFCGEFDTIVPTPAACDVSARQLEHACRNGLASTSVFTEFGLNATHPTFGPTGTCTSHAQGYPETFDGSVAVDYTNCTPERQSFCEAVYDEFYAECTRAVGNSCGSACGSGNDKSNWDTGGATVFDTPPGDPAAYCTALTAEWPDWYVRSGGALGLNTFHFARFCGEFDNAVPAVAECSVTGGALEHLCRNATGNLLESVLNSSHPSAGPIGSCASYNPQTSYDGTVPVDYTGCDVDRQNYCQAFRTEFELECNAGTCTGGGGPTDLLNGTETITQAGIGLGAPVVISDQDLFGTTVDITETAFNPGDYGLAAGEYVISGHTVTGNGVDSSNIDHHGSYGSNWDFTTTLTLTDSDGFTVDATLYEIVANGFIFTGCSQADVQNVESGACTGSITCTDYTPPCRTVDGVILCEAVDPTDGISEVLSPWTDFTTAVPEMCWSADVDIVDCVGQANCIGNPACVSDCGDLPPELQPACLADACWVDAQGTTICLDDTSESWANNIGDANFVDDCQDLLNDPSCTLMPDVACIEGMEDASDPTNVDLCRLRQRFFDCGQDVTVPGVPGADDVDITCGAQIRCLGDECGNTEAESNPDFVQAAVASTTLTESTKDMSCDIAGDPTSCKIFEGTDNRCKDPRGSYLGIIPDCCKQAREAAMAAGDFALYMQLAVWSFRLARDPMVASWLAQSQVLPSALQNVVNTPGAIRQSVGRAITSGFNSALEWAGFNPITIATETTTAQGLVSTSVTGFGPLQQYIATGFYNFLQSIGADQLAQSLFSTTVEGTVTDWAADGLGEMIGNVFGTIMFIYTVYSIVKILGNILFACEEEELSFGIQLVNRACHHVGTYCSKKVSFLGLKKCVIETQTHCCFSSPFARIINEQLREQGIGPDWGSATQPNCDGIQITELENVDWSLVDLSEWEAILFEAGLVPDPNNPPLNFIPSDRLPGDSAGGSEGMTSTAIMTETIDIIMPEFSEGRFDLEGAPLNQPDPELMPWYDDGVP